MKVIKMNAYMETARFPVKLSSSPEILPLPPYSTVIGMIHNACGWNEYHEVGLFVSGRGMQNQDFQLLWQGGSQFKKLSGEQKKRWSVIIEHNGTYTGFVQKPKILYFLSDLELELYIKPEKEDFDHVYNSIKYPVEFLSLGRHEDILRIDSVKIVDLQEKYEIGALKNDSYVPKQYVFDNFICAEYNINHKYEVLKDGFRHFNKIRCCYLDKDTKVYAKLFDPDNNNPVFLI